MSLNVDPLGYFEINFNKYVVGRLETNNTDSDTNILSYVSLDSVSILNMHKQKMEIWTTL